MPGCTKLNVAHPDASGRSLEQLFEVDASETAAKASGQHGNQAD